MNPGDASGPTPPALLLLPIRRALGCRGTQMPLIPFRLTGTKEAHSAHTKEAEEPLFLKEEWRQSNQPITMLNTQDLQGHTTVAIGLPPRVKPFPTRADAGRLRLLEQTIPLIT